MTTGCRPQELKALRWSDVDLDGDHVHIFRKKVGVPDALPLHPALKKKLRALRRLRRDSKAEDFIFENAVKGLFKLGDPDPAEVAKGEERFHRVAGVLNDHLKGKRHVADGRLTIADFALGASLNMAEMAKIPVGGYAEINRWFADLCALPAWRKSLAVPRAA